MKDTIIEVLLGLAIVLLISGVLIGGDANITEGRGEATEAVFGEEISWQVISSGGENNGTSANYGLAGTVGQTASGEGSSPSYGVNHGFWQVQASALDYVCGDADASGGVDIDDVVYLIAFIFSGGPEPVPYDSGDANCSGGVDIDDVVWLIAYIFSGGNAPCDIDGDEVPDC